MDIAYSVNLVPIRLTEERWLHIIENHDDMAGYYYDVLEIMEKPEMIVRGHQGTLKAIRNYGRDNWLVVIYREISKKDGFVITAFFSDEKPKGDIIWPRR